MEALARLDGVHREIRGEHGLGGAPFITAQQVHGERIGVVDEATAEDECFDSCDGLITNQRGVCLGIYVADCCAVFSSIPCARRSAWCIPGKKGRSSASSPNAIRSMARAFWFARLRTSLCNSVRAFVLRITKRISPAEIVRQCRDLGVTAVNDCGVCTACDLNRYYSYRAEKGRTGRMLAFLALR